MDKALETRLDNVEGETITEPRVIKFRTGQRRKHWNKNCVAMGLSSGFKFIITGIVLLLAVMVDSVSKRRRAHGRATGFLGLFVRPHHADDHRRHHRRLAGRADCRSPP